MPQRYLVVGCPGSGKSTMARAMAQRTGLPAVHLDKLFWRDHWTSVPAEEFDALLRCELAKDCWIIDGNFSRTLPMRLARAEAVVWLDYPLHVSLFGALRRVLTNYGKVRPDMSPNCPERLNWPFIRSILDFRRRNGAKMEQLLVPAPGREIIRLRSRRQARAFLDSLR
ncbi:MAG: hypothetical protein Q4A66_05875 [Eubacteriales bacterium]|nr:hypothetical protein [Eubacteriales bacterium]